MIRRNLIYNFNRIAFVSVIIGNIANIIQLLQSDNTSGYWLIFLHAIVWFILPIFVAVFGENLYSIFKQTKNNLRMSIIILIGIVATFLFTYSWGLWEIMK